MGKRLIDALTEKGFLHWVINTKIAKPQKEHRNPLTNKGNVYTVDGVTYMDTGLLSHDVRIINIRDLFDQNEIYERRN